MKRLKYIWILFFTTQGCIEEFQAETQALETLLVVDALITDELKRHEVELTRVSAFEEEDPSVEGGASVQIVDSQGTIFRFTETEPGLYRSETAFAAAQDRTYSLEISTVDGKEYKSRAVRTPNSVPIGDVKAERIITDLEEEGVGIFLNNDANGSEPSYFRFEYEETYKIIAPRWDPFRLRVVRYEPCFPDPFVVDIIVWEDERQTCFSSEKSKRLMQASSVDLENNQIDNFQLRFISRDNYIMSHRYSMEVTQYAQTQDAHSFYERLGDFSSSFASNSIADNCLGISSRVLISDMHFCCFVACGDKRLL